MCNILMMITYSLLILSALFFIIIDGAPLDSCTRIDDCARCVNSTNVFGSRCEWCVSSNSCNSVHSDECLPDEITLHQYNCPVDLSDVRYDEGFVRHTVFPLIATTHAENMHELSSSVESCFSNNAIVLNSFEVFCDETNITTCFAYTVLLKDYNALAMIFRGTTTLFQFIDEGISFFLHEKIGFSDTQGVVDGYYLQAFKNIWDAGMKIDFEKILNENPTAKFWFFGHSLGGGLASIGSLYTAKMYGLESNQVKLVTLGMPRVGDIELAAEHDKYVPDSWRIVHGKDPIPALLPRSYPDEIDSGSFHHRLEVWYPEGMKQGDRYVLGNRPDTTIGRSVFPFFLEDHFIYFDQVIETWHLKACRS